MIISKTKYNEIINRITILENYQEMTMKKTKEWLSDLEKRISEQERIVNNQPLIKKYQKTLDIFMKNAKN